MFVDKANMIPILALNKLLFYFRKAVDLTLAWREKFYIFQKSVNI